MMVPIKAPVIKHKNGLYFGLSASLLFWYNEFLHFLWVMLHKCDAQHVSQLYYSWVFSDFLFPPNQQVGNNCAFQFSEHPTASLSVTATSTE